MADESMADEFKPIESKGDEYNSMAHGASLVNQPVFFQIAHARAERGGGREGKKGLAKLARFLKSLGMFGGILHIWARAVRPLCKPRRLYIYGTIIDPAP